jgi:serine/threonine-protein kinase
MTMPAHLPLNEFIDIALDITKGLVAIHSKNLIHRDIKPENIICVEKTYKITDFGSLQQGAQGELRIGTPLYLPP